MGQYFSVTATVPATRYPRRTYKSRYGSSRSSRTHKAHVFKPIRIGRIGKHHLTEKRIMRGEKVTGFYKMVDDVILYHGEPVTGVNPMSFTELGNRWATTSFDIIYAGNKIADNNASQFKLLGGKYAGNAFDVYYGNYKTQINTMGFKYLGNGYAKDSFNTYYKGKKVNENSVPHNLEYSSRRYR